jgi:hypothetical protein
MTHGTEANAWPSGGDAGAGRVSRTAVHRMILASRQTQALYAATALGIIDLIAGGVTRLDDLARRTGANPGALLRLLRALASIGVLAQAEGADDRFALTESGHWLRADVPGSLRPVALLHGRQPHWHAWGRLVESVMTGEPTRRPQTEHAFLERHLDDPEDGAVFDLAMTAGTATHAPAILDAYDFSGFTRIVDVGGGQGALLATILKAAPGARGVLFDLPPVIAGAAAHIEANGVGDRCELVTGDCFQGVPAAGDAYVLKMVIHDWDDQRSLIILTNCRRVIRKGGRLLLIEPVMPDLIDTSERMRDIAFTDLQMLVGTGGHERTEKEFRTLYHQAGFRLRRIIPTNSILSIVEGVLA